MACQACGCDLIGMGETCAECGAKIEIAPFNNPVDIAIEKSKDLDIPLSFAEYFRKIWKGRNS